MEVKKKLEVKKKVRSEKMSWKWKKKVGSEKKKLEVNKKVRSKKKVVSSKTIFMESVTLRSHRTIHYIINYSTFIYPFESGKCG